MRNKKGTILIAALWIVTILTVFAVSAGRRSAISLKIASYKADRLKAYFIARAGILRVLAEKELEYKTNFSTNIDTLSQPWANNEEFFKAHSFGQGNYTVGYEYIISPGSDDNHILYGLMDESSKININTAPLESLRDLLIYFNVDESDAEEIAAAIIDWRDEDMEITEDEDGNFIGAEDVYYQGLRPSYFCKNLSFDTVYELLLVRGMTKEILKSIRPFITIYTQGQVNINTASEPVLTALFGEDFSELPSKILRYRQGADDEIGTEDDCWFSYRTTIIDRQEEGLVAIKNLQDSQWYANINGIATDEYNRIRELITGTAPQISVSSKTYRVIVIGEVKRVKVRIEAVYKFKDPGKPPVVEYWYQQKG